MKLATATIAILALVGATLPASGEKLPKEAGAPRIVALFELFCSTQLPNIEQIGRIAEAGKFKEITGPERLNYQSDMPADKLRVWRFTDQGNEYVLSAAEGRPDETFARDLPHFAESTGTACSILLPKAALEWPILDEMTATRKRAPDDTWEQPPLKAHFWGGVTETTLAGIYWWAPMKPPETSLPGSGGMLTANFFVKDD